MLNLRLSDVALWTHGTLHGADVPVRGVFTDTRAPLAGALFVALRGEQFDAHEFVAQAQAGGAAAALVERPLSIELPQVVVADTQLALGDLASALRAQRRARVVGITGSNGKTSVKTLLASILALRGRTHVNPGNLNNEIGLPLSLLALPEDADYAVFEMGAGKPGDIAYLAAIARPEVGLVNNIAPAHLERMGSLEGIAETKGALYSALPAHGVAVINADDAFAPMFAGLAGTRRVLRFGLDADADVRATNVRQDGTRMRFDLHLRAEGRGLRAEKEAARAEGRGLRAEDQERSGVEAFQPSALSPQPSVQPSALSPQPSVQSSALSPQPSVAPVALNLSGQHNVMNALAAAAIAHALGVPLDVIVAGLETAPSVKGRLQRHEVGGWTLIDDSYNANPGSTAAAIETLAAEPGPAWLVLGDMRELGADARELHAGIGALARERGIARLYTVGALAQAAAEAFGADARHFADQAALIAALGADVQRGVRVLVKGSRGSAMDRVVRALLDGAHGKGNGNGGGARDAA